MFNKNDLFGGRSTVMQISLLFFYNKDFKQYKSVVRQIFKFIGHSKTTSLLRNAELSSIMLIRYFTEHALELKLGR